MRFVIHEMPYETRIASGRFVYMRDGQPTGAVETWRLSKAVDGYEFLRVDLDAQAAPSGNSYLYHLTRDANGRPVQLKYRFWRTGMIAEGAMLLEAEEVVNTRTINSTRYEDVVAVPSGYGFWFPSVVGLGLLAELEPRALRQAVALQMDWEDPTALLRPYAVEVELETGPVEDLSLRDTRVTATPLTVRWNDQRRTVWLDEFQWPLQMSRDDGLTARETRYVRIT